MVSHLTKMVRYGSVKNTPRELFLSDSELHKIRLEVVSILGEDSDKIDDIVSLIDSYVEKYY